jgi:thioredoxin-related protein
MILLRLLIALVVALPFAARAESEWLTDFKKAQQQARSSHKPVLIEFTGSDWCPPCMMLRRDVFSTKEFQDYAAKNFVLLELDFPRRKEQARELVTQNQELAARFGIEVFPSIIIIDAEGKKLGELLGYDPGNSVQSYIDQLEKARKS